MEEELGVVSKRDAGLRGSRCGLDDHPLSSIRGLQGASKPLLEYCFKGMLWFLEDGHFCYSLA